MNDSIAHTSYLYATMERTASLAREITHASSKQSYFTACLLVDRDLVDDCCRAYGYFRWADDVIDLNSLPKQDRVTFIERQKDIINRLYRGEYPADLCSEESIMADLIQGDRQENSGLQSFIRNFMAILEFDAYRKGSLISQQALTWYSECLGKAVTDAIQYFVGNGYPYPLSPRRYLAAIAAHITHMLRDFIADLEDGYINLPVEYLKAHEIQPEDIHHPALKEWVRGQVELAREYFREGKEYLDQLEVLRCKIAGYFYCVRFECVLDAIEADSYLLRPEYNERRKLLTWIKLAGVAITITIRHLIRRLRSAFNFQKTASQ